MPKNDTPAPADVAGRGLIVAHFGGHGVACKLARKAKCLQANQFPRVSDVKRLSRKYQGTQAVAVDGAGTMADVYRCHHLLLSRYALRLQRGCQGTYQWTSLQGSYNAEMWHELPADWHGSRAALAYECGSFQQDRRHDCRRHLVLLPKL